MRLQDTFRSLSADDRRELQDAREAGLSRFKIAAYTRVLAFWHGYDLACMAAETAEAPQPAYGYEHRRALVRLARFRAEVQMLRHPAPAPATREDRAPARRSGIGKERAHYLHRVLGAWCSAQPACDLPEIVAARVLGRQGIVSSFAHDLSAEDEAALLAFVRTQP